MVVILGNRSLTDEVLLTTTCLVEQTLNARRPFTPASDDSEDLENTGPFYSGGCGSANVCIPFIPNAEIYAIHRKILDQAKLMLT